MNSLVESLLVTAFGLLIERFRGKFHEILARVGDKLNDKIEGSLTQLDDAAKAEFVEAIEKSFLPELKVEGKDD